MWWTPNHQDPLNFTFERNVCQLYFCKLSEVTFLLMFYKNWNDKSCSNQRKWAYCPSQQGPPSPTKWRHISSSTSSTSSTSRLMSDSFSPGMQCWDLFVSLFYYSSLVYCCQECNLYGGPVETEQIYSNEIQERLNWNYFLIPPADVGHIVL